MKKKIVSFFVLLSVMLTGMCPLTVRAVPFSDGGPDTWYAESVQYVSEKEIMKGTGDNMFDPDGRITRGMVVTILYRVEKTPVVSGTLIFTDVAQGEYYQEAVLWAAKNGIVNGYNTKQFGPNDSITREQFATILFRYYQFKEGCVTVNGSISQYTDADKVSSYAKDAMLWANANGLITGTSSTTLSPKDTATRAQAAAIIMRYFTNVAAENPSTEQQVDQQMPEDLPSEQHTTKPPIVISNSTILSVDTVTASAGDDNVAVSIRVMNNPGILGMSFSLTFDEDDLTLIKAENGSAFLDTLSLTMPARLKSRCRFIWCAEIIDENDVADGCVLTLWFHVSDQATGAIPISIQVPEDDVFDNDLNSIAVEIQNGAVLVS